jgi:hypothetical protein
MNAKNRALDTRILTAGDPCAVFPKNGAKTVLTKPTLSYMGYFRSFPPGRGHLFPVPSNEWNHVRQQESFMPVNKNHSCDCQATLVHRFDPAWHP